MSSSRRRRTHSTPVYELEKRIQDLEDAVKALQRSLRDLQHAVNDNQRNEWQEERELVTAEWDNQPGDTETEFITQEMLQSGRDRHEKESRQRFNQFSRLSNR